MPGELELKFRHDPDVARRLSAAGFDPSGAPARRRLLTVYYDTPDSALAARQIALRVRATGDGFVQTVKAVHDSFERFEFERPVKSARPDRAALPDPGAGDVAAEVHQHFDSLTAVFRTDFERLAWRLAPTASLTVELAIDQGRIVAGRARQPIAEVELERLEGSREEFLRWARGFALRHRLVLLLPTKSERGLRLARRLPAVPPAVTARPLALTPDLDLAGAARALIDACTGQMLANVEPLLRGTDPAAPHQLRVSLRRLRTVIRLFELGAADRRWRTIADGARRIADAAGRVRECDVFAAGPLAGLLAATTDDRALKAFAGALDAVRDEAREQVRAALLDHGFTRFVLSLALFTEQLAEGPGDPPLADHARERAFAHLKRLRRRCRAADAPEDWHQARIAAKNLRYILEAVHPLLPHPKRAARAARAAAGLQDVLGAAQDRASGQVLAARIADHGGLRGQRRLRAMSLIEGWQACEAAAQPDLRATSQTVLKELRRALKD
ncbi:MAG TPA: CYTH and CHAD domain-containing protein [Burkholderiaceae bacterium]|nr:CYTH and CHAD domain-containing protein [Burkholderiaceae bacterium]